MVLVQIPEVSGIGRLSRAIAKKTRSTEYQHEESLTSGLWIGVASTVSVWAAAAVAVALTCTIHDDAPQMFGKPSTHGIIYMPIS